MEPSAFKYVRFMYKRCCMEGNLTAALVGLNLPGTVYTIQTGSRGHVKERNWHSRTRVRRHTELSVA